jgi:hypothetical protein
VEVSRRDEIDAAAFKALIRAAVALNIAKGKQQKATAIG